MNDFPADHFPGTPRWARAAIASAIGVLELSLAKWQVPLEAIGRYESNWRNGANLCTSVEQNKPVGALQLARGMFGSAYTHWPQYFTSVDYANPEQQALVAVLYIDSRLPGYGGYGGIGVLDGQKGLLPRFDRGPGQVLNSWVADPDAFEIEAARELYRGY